MTQEQSGVQTPWDMTMGIEREDKVGSCWTGTTVICGSVSFELLEIAGFLPSPRSEDGDSQT